MNKRHLSKELHGRAAAYILGEVKTLKLRGDKRTVSAIHRVVEASRALYDTLTDCEPTSTAVALALANKKDAASDLRKITGITWLL